MKYIAIAEDVKLGENVKLAKFINLYGCSIGDNTKIGAFVEVQKNAAIGRNCKISSHTFICEGVTLEDNVFIGHNVTFINDPFPCATTSSDELQTQKDWKVERTLVKRGASVGSGATILSNVTIGENAIIGAGSVVTRDVPANAIVAGNPASLLRYIDQKVPSPLVGEGQACPERSRRGEGGMNNAVPFLDLITPHLELEEELIDVFRDALRTGRFIGGPALDGFEKDFASFCDAKYCIGVASGTDALRFALIAAGVNQGETVITVPNTFIATTEAISQAGAFIAFVDIDERTCNIDTEKLREYLETECVIDDETGKPISKKTKRIVSAIIPVHLYGQMADMDPISDLAEKYNLMVIEDACQAHGAEYRYSSPTLKKGGKGGFEIPPPLTGGGQGEGERIWKRAGYLGLAAAFSFYPGKNLGAFGEAGAVTTNDAEIARKISMIRDHGQSHKYYHDIEGYNGRLDAIQAGILLKKLKHLSEGNEKRRQSASLYNKLLNEVDGVITPYEPDWSRSVYHLYVIRVRNRDELQKDLSGNNIATGLHYPLPLHLQEAYECLGYREGAFPVSEKVASEILSLPMFPGLTEDQVEYVAENIKKKLNAAVKV